MTDTNADTIRAELDEAMEGHYGDRAEGLAFALGVLNGTSMGTEWNASLKRVGIPTMAAEQR